MTAYASTAMQQRRARILQETRRLIAVAGIEHVTLGAVSARAGVAVRTLHNAFGTRGTVIAAAVQERFAAHMAHAPNPHPPAALEHNLERMEIAARFFAPRRNYLRAALTLYFSADASGELRATIDRTAREAILGFVDATAATGDLRPAIERAELVDDLVRFEIATLHDWSQGRLAGKTVAPRLIRGHLALLIGATRGETRSAAEARLARIGA